MNAALPRDLRERFDAHVRAPLAALRRRALLYVAIEGGVRLATTLILTGLAQLALDWTLRLTVDQRAALNVAISFVWLWVIYRHLISPLVKPLGDRALAAALDRAAPDLHEKLSTAVQFAAGQVGPAAMNSPALVHAVIVDACESARGIRFFDVLAHRRARRSGLEFAGLAAAVAVAWFALPETMNTWFRRNWLVHELAWPQRTYIIPEGFDSAGRRRMPRGDEADIFAAIRGRTPTSIELEWWTDSGRRGRETMAIIGVAPTARASVSLGALSEPIHFRVSGGDEYTREYEIEPIERPSIVDTRIELTPPAYTRLGPATIEQQTTIEALQGSAVVITARVNKPVASARLLGPADAACSAELVDADTIRVAWDTVRGGAWSFELKDNDGWESRRGVRYTFKVVPDAPPTVRLALTDVSDVVTPLVELAVESTFADVYGLAAARVLVQRNDDPPTELPLSEFAPPQREFRQTLVCPLESLAAQPGDRVRVWAEALDIDPLGPNVGRTEPLTLRVLAPPDFLAEMARREMELRQEFERLMSEQGGVKDSLERLVAGLSPEQPPAAIVVQRIGGLARRQDGHGVRTLAIRRSFERILAEMRRNRVARTADEQRLAGRIAVPLEQVGQELMPRAASQMNELRRLAARPEIDAATALQADILRRMRQVLASMLELEGFREAVALLQEIIADQKSIQSDSLKAISSELDALLGEPSLPKNPTPDTPAP